MEISANIESGYKFKLSPNDTPFIPDGFKSYLTTIDGGLTFSSVEMFPDFVVMALPIKIGLFVFPGIRTYYPKSKFSGLKDHGLTVSSEFNSIITIVEAAIPKPYRTIKSDGKLFIANHIPQLFQSFNGSIISGVEGKFDFKNNYFYGFLYFGGL